MAGRPLGKKDSKPRVTAARKLAEIASRQGLTPLQVMQATMQKAWDLALKLEAEKASDAEVLAMMQVASKEAYQAAPFIHAKLASETHRVLTDDSQRSIEDLERERDEIAQRRAATQARTGDRAGAMAPTVPQQPPGMVH